MFTPRHLTSFQVLSRFTAVFARFLTIAARFIPLCYVLARFSRQARVFDSRFAAFNYDASRRVTVYRPGALRRIAFHYGLTRRMRSRKEYKKAGQGREDSTWTDARRPVPRLWICSAEVQGERRYENGNTTTTRSFIRVRAIYDTRTICKAKRQGYATTKEKPAALSHYLSVTVAGLLAHGKT